METKAEKAVELALITDVGTIDEKSFDQVNMGRT